MFKESREFKVWVSKNVSMSSMKFPIYEMFFYEIRNILDPWIIKKISWIYGFGSK